MTKTPMLLGLLVLLQWNPGVSCTSCLNCAGGGNYPIGPMPYDSCATAADCDTNAPLCSELGTCTKACSSDADCPVSNVIGSPRPGACVRVDGGAAFCTYYAVTPYDCLYPSLPTGDRSYAKVGGPGDAGTLVCLPDRFGCGDGLCGGGEDLESCPIDCQYEPCFVERWDVPLPTCTSVGICIPVGRDGGPIDAGNYWGICERASQQTCADAGACPARAGFPGVCQSGFSLQPACFQTCTGPDRDCLPRERCVPSGSGGSICVP